MSWRPDAIFGGRSVVFSIIYSGLSSGIDVFLLGVPSPQETFNALLLYFCSCTLHLNGSNTAARKRALPDASPYINEVKL